MYDKNAVDIELKESMKAMKLIEGRNRIIAHNNLCVLETIIFYENTIMYDIIRPFMFNDNYSLFPDISNVINEKLSIMDKYIILCRIAKQYGVKNFKKFDEFIRIRNKIAHSFTAVKNINSITKESDIFFAGVNMTWTEYKKMIKEWTSYSLEMASFVLEVFKKVNTEQQHASFMYCKLEGDCIIVQHNLIYPEIEGEYVSFFKNGFNMDLLDYANDEYRIYNSSRNKQ